MSYPAPSDPTAEPLRTQLIETFEAAEFPIRGPGDFRTAMAAGRSVFVVDGIELVVLELSITWEDQLSFPYEDPDELVGDVTAALRRGRRE
jgi:hypothetical protein